MNGRHRAVRHGTEFGLQPAPTLFSAPAGGRENRLNDSTRQADGKQVIRDTARRLMPELMEIARWLHDHPELSGEEEQGSRLLADRLSKAGFQVEFGAGDLPTAFVARHGTGAAPVVAFLAEYDALPEIGHGCGHNLIGTAALGAALVLASAQGDRPGEIRVVGTPAEETLGGKVVLVDAGVFQDVDAAIMVHPSAEDRVLSDSLACQSLEVTYLGRAAHAVAHPEKGLNALDPLLALFAARDAILRQSRIGVRIVGVITEGGVRPNVIPDRAVGRFSLRAPTRAMLNDIVASFRRHAQSLGEGFGCKMEIRPTDNVYDEMITNVAMADAYRDNLAALGVSVNDAPREHKGSLDMGNVSHAVPSVHPFFALVPAEVASHTREFAAATLTSAGQDGLLRSVQAMAMTGLDLLDDPDLLRRAKQEHAARDAAHGETAS
jgi:amidohydrolase